MDAAICNLRAKILIIIRMQKVFTVLGVIAMASLALAIARQLSEQKHGYDNYAPYS